MSSDDIRLVYTDDPDARGRVGQWLDRRDFRAAQHTVQVTAETPEFRLQRRHTRASAAGDGWKLRGIPVVGVPSGRGGAMPCSRPGGSGSAAAQNATGLPGIGAPGGAIPGSRPG